MLGLDSFSHHRFTRREPVRSPGSSFVELVLFQAQALKPLHELFVTGHPLHNFYEICGVFDVRPKFLNLLPYRTHRAGIVAVRARESKVAWLIFLMNIPWS